MEPASRVAAGAVPISGAGTRQTGRFDCPGVLRHIPCTFPAQVAQEHRQTDGRIHMSAHPISHLHRPWEVQFSSPTRASSPSGMRIRRMVLGALRASTLGLLAALIAPSPGTTQTSVGFSLSIGATAPSHPLFIGATPGAFSGSIASAAVVSPGMVMSGVVTTGVAWAHPQPAWNGWGPDHRRSWRHRRASRLNPSCWSAWKDPWFAHWPYCDAGGFAAWTWIPVAHPWGWTYAHPVAVGLISQGHAHAYPRSHRVRHRDPGHVWALAMSIGFGPHWSPPPLWYGGMVYAPVPVIHVVNRPLWTVQAPPAQTVARGGPTFGGAGWVTQPEYKEDPAAPLRTAAPRGVTSQGTPPVPAQATAASAGEPSRGARGVASPTTTPSPTTPPSTTRVVEDARTPAVQSRAPAPSTRPAASAPTRPPVAPGRVTTQPANPAPAPAARGAAPAPTAVRAPAGTATRAPSATSGRAPAPAPSASPGPPTRSTPAASPSTRNPAAPAPAPSARPENGNPGVPTSGPATRTAPSAGTAPSATAAPAAAPSPARR